MWDNTWGINGFFLSAQKQPDEDFNQQKHWDFTLLTNGDVPEKTCLVNG